MSEVLLVVPECWVFKVPPRTSATGYKCEEWGKPIAPALRLKLLGDADSLRIQLEDATTGQRFATCPIDIEHPEVSVEPAIDSSRFFVLRIVEGDRHAFLGLGFKERTHSFDLNVAIQDYIKRLKRAKEPVVAEPLPQVDYSLKQGEKVHISLNFKKKT